MSLKKASLLNETSESTEFIKKQNKKYVAPKLLYSDRIYLLLILHCVKHTVLKNNNQTINTDHN